MVEYTARTTSNFAMINNMDYMNAKFGSTCKFFAIEDFKIRNIDWSIYAQKGSPYMPLLKYQ